MEKGNRSDPANLLQKMNKYLQETSIKGNFEAWIVTDKDNWNNEQLEKLHKWSLERGENGFTLSNPKFEYWILLHFEDGSKVSSSKNCTERLKKYIPKYQKKLNPDDFDVNMIKQAVKRAKTKDTPLCKKWPQGNGSTVYRLVQNILNETD